MSSINNGGQILTFDYKQGGTSQGFNRLFYKVLPKGIINGGELNRVTDTSITIAPMICMFEDLSAKVTVRIETTQNATVGVSTSAPYVIAKFKWINVEENFVEFTASEYSPSLEEEGIIIGKCVYRSNVLTGFDYSRKNWSQDHFLNKNYLDFRVSANEPEDTSIVVGKGEAVIGGKRVKFEGGTKAINTMVSQQRIDLVSINRDGEIVITEGVQSESPKTPVFPSDMLTVGVISLPSNPQSIKGNMIENIYNSNFIQSSSLTKTPILIQESTSIETIEEDSKYVISGSEVVLTLGKGAYMGCEIQVIMASKGSIKYRGINSETLTDTVLANRNLRYTWNGTSWYCSSAPEIGAKYEQYPDDNEPSLIYGGQWESKKYGGVFPRLEGGDAKPFTTSFEATNSATTVTFGGEVKPTTDQLKVDDILIYDNEYRVVTELQTSDSTVTSCTIDKQFTNYSKITNIILGQNESLPNIKGKGAWSGIGYGLRDDRADEHNILGNKLEGCFSRCDDPSFEVRPDYEANVPKIGGNGIVFDASKKYSIDGTFTEHGVYQDGAKVTTLNFTSKLWLRKF